MLIQSQTNQEWINNVLDFYGMDAAYNGSDLTDIGDEKEMNEISAGNLVVYTEPVDEEAADIAETSDADSSNEESPEEPEKLFAVYKGDGEYYTVSSDGEKLWNASIEDSQVVAVYDMEPKEEDILITNHDVPYYNQGEFAGVPYNNGSVACFKATLSNLNSHWVGKNRVPVRRAAFACL